MLLMSLTCSALLLQWVFHNERLQLEMGSGSSAQKETQSAPATARTTPKQPKRNRQFEEVQIAQGGSTSRSRGASRSQGPSPHPGKSGQDPGASGSTSDRRPQQATASRGGASNGRKVPFTQLYWSTVWAIIVQHSMSDNCTED